MAQPLRSVLTVHEPWWRVQVKWPKCGAPGKLAARGVCPVLDDGPDGTRSLRRTLSRPWSPVENYLNFRLANFGNVDSFGLLAALHSNPLEGDRETIDGSTW